MNIKIVIIILFLWPSIFFGQDSKIRLVEYNEIKSGADQLNSYIQLLGNKNIAIVANQASLVDETHLVDTLVSSGVKISKIFCPEHGFRGKADAGMSIEDGVDPKTNIPIISLYGSHKKPTSDDLQNIDAVLFDLQDVGTRFYTYISTLTYVMEACAENNIPIIVLDRPNPNAYLVDGPVLEKEYSSFVGLHPVPVVYGMTIGEYAKMVAGEQWINNADDIELSVIPLSGWDRNMIVKLKIKPSPNLPNWQSVFLYPSLCMFEGTIMSVGRGTDKPFQIYGHPNNMIGSYLFEPKSSEGASNPKYKGQKCYGSFIYLTEDNINSLPKEINLYWLTSAYKLMIQQGVFFNSYFAKLAGNDRLRTQIEAGLSETEIRNSWQQDITNFKKIRSKYLIYP